VDARELPGVDMIAEVSDLPVEPGLVEQIFSAHPLEHFPQEVLRGRVLQHWFALLNEGGLFSVVDPDAYAMIRNYVADSGPASFDDLREALFGEQEYEGNFHYNMFSQPQLELLLTQQQLIDITWVADGRRQGKRLEMQVKAVKPRKDGGHG
jgi:predicted SAM-dependent methyltransferase